MIGIADLVNRYRVSENPLKTERRVELTLVIVVCILLLQVLYAVSGAGRLADIAPIAPAADAIAPVAGESPVIPSLQQSTEMEKRPLFWASRRPVPAQGDAGKNAEDLVANKPAGSQAGELKQVKLVAVFAQGDESVVILLAGRDRHRLSVGDEIQGWTVESVDAGGMSIRNGEDVQRLDLVRRDITAQFTAPVSATDNDAGPAAELDPQAAAEAKARQEADNTLSFGGG